MRASLRDIAINIIAQLIWVSSLALSAGIMIYLFGTANLRKVLGSTVAINGWLVLFSAVLTMSEGILLFIVTRRASAVRGREDATRANVALMRERAKVDPAARVVRSTRFGRWPRSEVLTNRSNFRQELDKAIIDENSDVRRIWNISSLDDVHRLREILKKYEGHANHSIRGYFDVPDHAMPELLIVDERGASMSFPSSRNPHDLDWMMRFRRRDLTLVVRDYFDVLWDRAYRLLDSGEVTADCVRLLREAENRLSGP